MQDQEQKIASISQELALFQINELARDNELEKRIKELEKSIGEFMQSHTGLERLGGLEDRIKTLEDSRQRQIALNSTFAVKEIKEVPKIEIPNINKPSTTHSIWDLFK